MTRLFPVLLTALTFVFAQAAFGQLEEEFDPQEDVATDKRGQTGFKFLMTSLDARAASMGDAVTAETQGTSTALFYNPASMAWMDNQFHVSFGQTQFIADFVYNAVSAAYRPSGGNYGVIGISAMAVDYGDFIGTVRANNDRGFEEVGTYAPTALAIGVGYARTFTDRFSVGAQAKYVTQDLGSHVVNRTESGSLQREDYSLGTMAFDFGILYKTGFRSLVVAMTTRNFGSELTYVRENFELPLHFQIGVAMDLLDLTSMDQNVHSLKVAVDASRPRDFNEHFKFGGEYTISPVESVGISLRGGLGQAAEEQGFSAGAGLRFDSGSFGVNFDYGYTDFGIFGGLNRLALQIFL